MLKKVAPLWCAMALPISVLPVPGGPKSSSPLGSARSPLNRSGRVMGQQISSVTHFLAKARPEMSLKETGWPRSKMSAMILSTSSRSKFSNSGGRGSRFSAPAPAPPFPLPLPLLLFPLGLAYGRLALSALVSFSCPPSILNWSLALRNFFSKGPSSLSTTAGASLACVLPYLPGCWRCCRAGGRAAGGAGRAGGGGFALISFSFSSLSCASCLLSGSLEVYKSSASSMPAARLFRSP
mmetsp:Transcript_2410/g.5117  ORF Transcript_2410/g.5117 Transcript_2410/m.5117 type:complete len:238 (+) Transcript_2410:770-1483(+)